MNAAVKLLSDVDYCGKWENVREASEELLRGIPRSLPAIKKVLFSSPHRRSGDVRFTFFMTTQDASQRKKRVLLPLMREFLMRAADDNGKGTFECGCSLGDEWYANGSALFRKQLSKALVDCMFHAQHAVGRDSAFHGLEHVLNKCSQAEGLKILEQIRLVAQGDRSPRMRFSALRLLRDGYWWGVDTSSPLRKVARRLAKGVEDPIPVIIARQRERRKKARSAKKHSHSSQQR